MLSLKKLSLSTVTISNLDTTKIKGGKGSTAPWCSSNPTSSVNVTTNCDKDKYSQ